MMERLEALYQEVYPEQKEQVQQMIRTFEEFLDGQNPRQIQGYRRYLEKAVSMLEYYDPFEEEFDASESDWDLWDEEEAQDPDNEETDEEEYWKKEGTAIFGTVLPPFLIISVISVFYQMFCDNFIISQLLDGMQAGVGAVIASVVWDMAAGITKKKEWTSIVIMAAAFIASYVMEIPVVYIVLICIVMGVIRTVLAGRGKREK